MDVLSNKQKRTYNYTSRYSAFPYYYHEVDNKYMYGLTSQLKDNTNYVLHNVTQKDSLDSLSYKYYGRPDLYWIIADFNKINDPFCKLWGKYKTIKIPAISNVDYK